MRTIVFFVFLYAGNLRRLKAPTLACKRMLLICRNASSSGKAGRVLRSTLAMLSAQILQFEEDLIVTLLQPVLFLPYLLQLDMYALGS